MRYLVFVFFAFCFLHVKSQSLIEGHTIGDIGYNSMLKYGQNTVLWFDTPLDSVVIDDQTVIARKQFATTENSAFFVVFYLNHKRKTFF